MAQNIVPTSNRPDITNNNRLYPTYPYLDRYGLAFTLSNNIAPDGRRPAPPTSWPCYVYRENTLEEYTLLGGALPGHQHGQQLLPITLTQLRRPARTSWCSGATCCTACNNTLDYPWSTVVSGTALIDTSAVLQHHGHLRLRHRRHLVLQRCWASSARARSPTATATSTSTRSRSTPSARTTRTNQLWLQSPYAGGISFHLNATIQTAGRAAGH